MDKELRKKVAAVAVICVAAFAAMFIIMSLGEGTGKETHEDKILESEWEMEEQANARANEIIKEISEEGKAGEETINEIEAAYTKVAEYIDSEEELSEEEMLDMLYNSALIFKISTNSADAESNGKLNKTLLYKFSSPTHNISINYLDAAASGNSSYEKGFEDDLNKSKQLASTINENKEKHINTFAEELAKALQKNDEN